jgi:hypothetical protein
LKTRICVQKYEVTFCCDGWNNIQNHPLQKVIQCGTNGNLVLGTINIAGTYKYHKYVVNVFHPFV